MTASTPARCGICGAERAHASWCSYYYASRTAGPAPIPSGAPIAPANISAGLGAHRPTVSDGRRRDEKPSNPKDAVGGAKLPTNLVPTSLFTFAVMAFAEGASKYGAYNWRIAGVRASIYKAAHDRHMDKWWNGEECDPATKVPHLASATACLGILIDAKACGMLTDDRPPASDVDKLIRECEEVVLHVLALNKDRNPRHYTIADTVGT